MLFSLNINSVRDVLKRRGARAIAVHELPQYAQEQTGLHAMTMSTDLLAGATRETLVRIRESGDRVGCACLLLSETDALPFGDPKDKPGEDAVHRMTRVVEAASLLGCNSASMQITAKDNDESMELVADRVRIVLERADRLEIMVLIRPSKGLTEQPERLTDLIKMIGGFRIGTMPDFEQAVASGDAVHYLKKLTPYASVVNAATLGFREPQPLPTPEKPATKRKKAPDPEPDADDDALSGEDALLAALAADLDALDEIPPPEHEAYDLFPLVGAIRAVGFDGTLAIDYRGKGDGTVGVLQSRDALEAAIEASED